MLSSGCVILAAAVYTKPDVEQLFVFSFLFFFLFLEANSVNNKQKETKLFKEHNMIYYRMQFYISFKNLEIAQKNNLKTSLCHAHETTYTECRKMDIIFFVVLFLLSIFRQ